MNDHLPPETTNQPYDVFLSHNSKDKPAVETLAVRLADEARIKVWLDKWNLIPGEPWQEEIEHALDQAHTCAVFLGPHEFGGWHHEEMRAALNRRVADRTPKFRVIPVLLPGATTPDCGKLPAFLSRLTWVDFRQGLDDAEAFRRLVAGIRGIAPGRSEGGAEYPDSGLDVFDERSEELSRTLRKPTRVRRVIWLAVVLLAVSLAAMYWQAKTERTPESVPAMQIIVDNAQGQPAVGALVEIDALPGQTFITNSDGAVSIANIPRQPGDKIRIKASNGKTTADVYLPFLNPNSEHIVLR